MFSEKRKQQIVARIWALAQDAGTQGRGNEQVVNYLASLTQAPAERGWARRWCIDHRDAINARIARARGTAKGKARESDAGT